MGKQILFYMSQEDEEAFVDYLRSTGDVAIVPQTSRKELQEEFGQFTDAEGRELGESCHLWNRSISPRPVVTYYPQQEYYWLDFLQSEVVNVMRSKMTEDGLSMGRLHIEDKIRDADGQMRPKFAEFEAWFSYLCRWIKQRSVRVIDGADVLPGADELIQLGTQVTGHKL
jgi:hypothetical protein